MTIIANSLVVKQDIADRFQTRVRDWVSANVNWVRDTGAFNVTVGYITANSSAFGGGINRNSDVTTVSPTIQLADLTGTIGAGNNVAGKIVQTVKNFMTLYANTHMITLANTGNLAPAAYTGIVKLDGAPAGLITNIQTDVVNAASANAITDGTVITATNLNNFIEACRSIWTNRAATTSMETFYYYYCHSSCHTNYTCYSSRGRR